jgi:nucleoside-triphosphatase
MGGTITNILLTGRPGIGKTTVIVRLAELLGKAHVAGFFTEEIRVQGQRRGFRVRCLGGKSCTLADTSIRSRWRVGRYGVDVSAFEALAVSELNRDADLYVIDEIGKMECFSDRFVGAARAALDGPMPVIATVAASGGGFIREVKAREDVEILEVTAENRDVLPSRLHARASGGA